MWFAPALLNELKPVWHLELARPSGRKAARQGIVLQKAALAILVHGLGPRLEGSRDSRRKEVSGRPSSVIAIGPAVLSAKAFALGALQYPARRRAQTNLAIGPARGRLMHRGRGRLLRRGDK